ncbi:PREDICTED: armadillo repeat-containing kinesin-like protein 2 [Fragaria vesca subsp. vesca]|uniref:armadillo repeat-containing kinesin-like protein 2 n=1 Tax=Fragaria vesca subsp. vesca TaxID=101020 RepID=UPI0002C37006|nr:PREDICTED: armadillo repeat-containing kinesin-like protein 2 [Fragaria vesca subsp. vesca]
MAYRNGVAAKGAVKLDRPVGFRTSSSFKSKLPPSPSPGSALRRSAPSLFGGSASSKDDHGVPGRVRVAVRLRPRNAEESAADADFADCVELQPELKRLKLRKNNWDTDTYEFDEVLTEYASQKRVYEVVAKPVVESVLDGYNGTVMAYGQTGTGKTFTLGRLGEEDTSDRGIMVRSMEDILADISLENDSVSVSYLQLYMETLQDLLDPANDNIPIVEDPKTGDVSVPKATVVDIKDQLSFLELLRVGEAHRIAANTKLNTESSRSHAILMVNVKRCVMGSEDHVSIENGDSSHLTKPSRPLVRKSKLVVVDLAGSERIQKSGSEGHMLEEAKCINLSLSALGKCINSLAENSSHVPFRDSKLTRLLRDSFGGSARTSLIVTIGPSPRHRGETSSTILFGQRAMKVENMLKIKEEFDYKSLSRKLEIQVDMLIAQSERQNKTLQDEVERLNLEAEKRISEVERNFADALEKERRKCQMDYMEAVKKLEEKLVSNQKQDHEGMANGKRSGEEASAVQELLRKETQLRKEAEKEVENLKSQLALFTQSEAGGTAEIVRVHKMLEEEAQHKKKLEEEIVVLRSQLLQLNFEAEQMRSCFDRAGPANGYSSADSSMSSVRHSYPRDVGNGPKAPVSTLFEQVGLQKILSLLESEDANVRIHAVKVVANLAAEETNQKRIVEAGGLTSLLMLLRSFEDETVRRVAAGAIANLAMNEANQEHIMVQGGISLLATTAADADDAQTLRMVAGAIANLCGNDKLQTNLRTEGGIKALLGIVRCGHPDVLSQVARGIANFAKCESRACTQGIKSGRSILIEDGALPWIVQNANDEAAPIRRHIELALCHLAQHEVNAKDMISGGALWELVRISRDCSREDIRTLARRILNSSPTFRAELRRLRIDY